MQPFFIGKLYILYMKKISLFLFFQIITFNFFSQKELILYGEFQTEFFDNETKETAKKRAKENAIVNALEKGFGTSVIQDNTLHLKNINSGVKTETKSVFNSISQTQVNGELLEELNVVYEEIPFPKNKSNGVEISLEIKCKVKIRAREYVEANPSFYAFTLNCIDTLKCKTYSFKKNDSLLVYFKSLTPGYISIFIDDNEKANYIFPYMSDIGKYSKGYPVEAGKEYFLFSKHNKHKLSPASKSDRLVWTVNEGVEKLNIIFSPTPFEIPDMVGGNRTIPSRISSDDFRKWLINLRIINKQIEIKKITLTSVF